MHQEELSLVLRARRETLGITQEHLSELSGVALRTLKAMETSKGNPTLSTLRKIVEVLGLEIKLEVKQTLT
ncbi:MAG: helix-turn-helix transcriptional regulator [Saprospiraceae bacterium]